MLMNDSIKRVQSQAGLSFAERENLRPEVKEKDFMKSAGRRGYSPLARVMTLAVMLLAMAATAWAQQTYTVTFSANNNTVTVENVTLPHTFSASYNTANEEFDLILKELYGWSGNTNYLYPATAYDLEVSDGTKVVSTKPDSYTQCLTINNVFEGSVTVNGTYVVDGSEFEYTVAISISAPTKYTVTMAEGAGEGWTIEPAEATTTGVDKDTKITATYSGTKHVKSVTAVVKAAEPEGPTLATPLTVEALTAGTIVVNSPKSGMQYSLNGGTKTAVSGDITVEAGDKVAFYGNGTSITVYDGTVIQGSGDGFTCKVYGNIMSLVDENNYETATTLPNVDYVFYELFSGNTALTDASQLLLPATTLASRCYYSMFRNCVNLTAAPELPATELTNYCYGYMFNGCTSLTAAPELPATTLADYCYSYMFNGCSGLTAAPALPATTLAPVCYRQMFQGCTGLTAAPVLPAETLVSSCYNQMFKGCSNLSSVTCLATSLGASNTTGNWLNGVSATGTFTAASGATWTEGSANGIPTGWTRVNKQ